MNGGTEAVQAYLSLGANLGDASATIRSALRMISELPLVLSLEPSPFYRTQAVGKTDQPDFINCAAGIRTEYPPVELLHHLKAIESHLGRINRPRWYPREIDIDIVLYGNRILHSTELTIPHPFMHERRFVLVPLEHIAPHMHHPVLSTDVRTLLSLCPDRSSVEILEPEGS